jgi:uncharacterized protein (TIGR02246 family)
MRLILISSFALAALLALLAFEAPARAGADTDKDAIAARLRGWAKAFNAGDENGACDVFATDLIATVPGSLDGARTEVCDRLAAVFAKSDSQYSYEPDIREIIISGDIAVVRLFWTLSVRRATQIETSKEAGLDIFKRQTDGKWSIIRFLSFPIAPDK